MIAPLLNGLPRSLRSQRPICCSGKSGDVSNPSPPARRPVPCSETRTTKAITSTNRGPFTSGTASLRGCIWNSVGEFGKGNARAAFHTVAKAGLIGRPGKLSTTHQFSCRKYKDEARQGFGGSGLEGRGGCCLWGRGSKNRACNLRLRPYTPVFRQQDRPCRAKTGG